MDSAITPLTALWLAATLGLRIALIASLQRLSRSEFAQSHRVYDIAIQPPQHKRERSAHAIGAVIDALALGLLIQFQWIHFVAPSLTELVIFLTVHAVVVEPLYYGYHRLLHTRYLFTHHHYLHHLSTVAQPATSFTFTLAERISYTALFATPILVASYLDALSLVGVALYMITFDLVNAIGHFNFEFFPKSYGSKRARFVFYTPTFHARHHAKFKYNYALFMPLWDHLFKTADPDEQAVFLRTQAGQAMKSLSEKVAARRSPHS